MPTTTNYCMSPKPRSTFFACIFRDINQVNLAKDLGLVIFCWGDDNNCKETIKYLKEKGLHAIIYDKVDLLIDNEKVNKVSISFIWVHTHSCLVIKSLSRSLNSIHRTVINNTIKHSDSLITAFIIARSQLDKTPNSHFCLTASNDSKIYPRNPRISKFSTCL